MSFSIYIIIYNGTFLLNLIVFIYNVYYVYYIYVLKDVKSYAIKKLKKKMKLMERWCDDNDTMVWWWWCDGTIVRWRWCDDVMTMVRWLWGNIFYRTIVIASSHHGAIDFFADKLFPRIWSQMWVFFISETLIFLACCCKIIKNVSNDFFCLEINLKKKLSVEYGNSYQGEGGFLTL